MNGEQAFPHILDSRLDYLRLCDLVRIGHLNRSLRQTVRGYVRTIVQKIVISSAAGVSISIYTTNGREVYNKTSTANTMRTFIRYLREVGVRPKEIDLMHYDHRPFDPLLEDLHQIVSRVKRLAMASENHCQCEQECIRLEVMAASLKRIFSISPPTLLYTTLIGVEELHLDAGIPMRCLQRLSDQYNFHVRPVEILRAFKNHITMLVRSLSVTDTLTVSIRRNLFAALIEKMRVEELHLKGERTAFRAQGVDPPTPRDLRFAEGEDNARVHWNTADPKMPLLKLTYQPVDSLPCAEVIRKLMGWFEVQKLLEISFPRARTVVKIMQDLEAVRPLLVAFAGEKIKLEWTVERTHDRPPNYNQICRNIADLFQRYFRVYEKTCPSETYFLLRLSSGVKMKELKFTFTVAPEPVVEDPLQDEVRRLFQELPPARQEEVRRLLQRLPAHMRDRLAAIFGLPLPNDQDGALPIEDPEEPPVDEEHFMAEVARALRGL